MEEAYHTEVMTRLYILTGCSHLMHLHIYTNIAIECGHFKCDRVSSTSVPYCRHMIVSEFPKEGYTGNF